MDEHREFKITPLGAAIVEAMPDRELMRKIRRNYKRDGRVPESKLFPAVPPKKNKKGHLQNAK